ncbi:enoyl-CoA hydratase/isomerase family protein [Pseudonocardia sp. KRD291]|uniref:enoyl-CoA hydratase/isomerase family protein n=1 Tax=Pseudonocardia sp. KRD291 TaxID=2792007 RepID=UPI001C4A651A|nr:enoyl-CoA hydratase/isomerase family protein [Pseudonocardia sp. KRD291]MBW0101032.1 enoyl-CoA hydratase/isomerase family protein [Pseudonocardia sp. KRD291]
MSERFTLSTPRNGVTLVTMDRPAKLNAMDPTFFRELVEVCAELDRDPDVRAAVITGAGRAFSAGGDIDSFHDLAGDTPRIRAHLRLVFEAFSAVERCGIPVVGAVNGIAHGGGTELTLACDVALAARTATFAFREATIGLTPGWGIVRGPEVMGRHWTRLLALTGRIVDAATAERAGLVQEVVPDAELLDRALDLAMEMAALPPLAVQVGKAFVNRDTGAGFAESIEATALLFTTPEHRDAVAAFRAARGR